MSDAPKEYEIATVSDLLKIPKDRRYAFISEMPALFAFMDLTAIPGVGLERIVWRDDGKQDHEITFHVRGAESG